jgi:hypothetical protein
MAAFWVEIAKGLIPIEAAGVVGVSPPVAQRWFHNAGGMPPFDLKFRSSGRYLSFAEREEIALLRIQGQGVREIARTIVETRGRSRGSCVAMPPFDMGATDIVRLSRSGKQTSLHSARRSRSWSPTRNCTHTCSSGSRDRSVDPTGRSSRVLSHRDSLEMGSHTARIGPGHRRGARNRSRTGSSSTSPMMGR